MLEFRHRQKLALNLRQCFSSALRVILIIVILRASRSNAERKRSQLSFSIPGKARFFLLLLAAFCFPLLADETTEGWSWGVGCPGDGTTFTSGFTASTSGGFSGSGSCARTSTHFTQFSFTASSGGTAYNTTQYGLHTGDWLIIPPTLSTEYTPIYTVSPECPSFNKTLNWIFVQWDNGTRTLSNTYVPGTANYDTSAGITITDQYDVTGVAYFTRTTGMPGSCSSGIYTVSGQSSDLNGTVYFNLDGSGVDKTTAGHATFFMPQYSVTASTDLAGMANVEGMSFDSYNEADTRNISVSTDPTGMYFTIKPYSNAGTGTIDSSYTDTITITHVNSPQNGMLIGSVTRTGTGAGTGNIACILNRSLDVRVICSGQFPANNNYPYTVAFVKEGLHVLGQADTMSQITIASGLNAPYGGFSDGTRFYVADQTNSRVLIWNTIPTTTDTAPNIVLGQPNVNSNWSNNGGLGAQSLSGPASVFSDGTRLYVTDMQNNRVLIWNAIPTTTQAPANLVVGQPNMTSNTANNGGLSAETLSSPHAGYSDGTRLFISDYNNKRVLIWNAIPTQNQAPANLELGESDMTTNTYTGPNAQSLDGNPLGVFYDGTRLYVADYNNQRVLIGTRFPHKIRRQPISCWASPI